MSSVLAHVAGAIAVNAVSQRSPNPACRTDDWSDAVTCLCRKEEAQDAEHRAQLAQFLFNPEANAFRVVRHLALSPRSDDNRRAMKTIVA